MFTRSVASTALPSGSGPCNLAQAGAYGSPGWRNHQPPPYCRVLLALACGAFVAACSDDTAATEPDESSDTASPDTSVEQDADAGVAADVAPDVRPSGTAEVVPEGELDPAQVLQYETSVTWEPCGLFQGVADPRAECAYVTVPLSWEDPTGETIEIFVKRITGDAYNGRAVWMLAGGPGFSGAQMESAAALYLAGDDSLRIYIPDHRGTGRSARLTCSAESSDSERGNEITEAEQAGCLEELNVTWNNDPTLFSSTAAAQDLGRLIALTYAENEKQFVFGLSYGTWLAIRYLALFPQQSDGVVLDSICGPGACNLVMQDEWYDQISRQFFEEDCPRSETCTERLGEDPWASVEQALSDISDGTCNMGRPLEEARYLFRIMLAQLMLVDIYRPVAGAVVYRVLRCSEEDRRAIRRLEGLLFGPKPQMAVANDEEPPQYSQLLATNIALSEIAPAELPMLEDLTARVDALTIVNGVGPQLVGWADVWPRYAPDGWQLQEPTTTVPMIMLNAEIDPATPEFIATQSAEQFDEAYQWYFVYPEASHNAFSTTPTRLPYSGQCGLAMLLDFLDAPTVRPDDSCMQNLLTTDWDMEGALVQRLLGTFTLWDE